MNEKHNIDSVLGELVNNKVDLQRMSAKDISKIKAICDQMECIVWLTDHRMVKPILINEHGRGFYGIGKTQAEIDQLKYEDMLHPDHFSDLRKRIAFFTDNPGKTHKMTFYIKEASGEYRWTYSEARGISFDLEGNPTHILSVVYDIDACLMRQPVRKKPPNYRTILQQNKSLTKREKEILNLIANELTSVEIAARLFIEPTTVDSHRKHIIKKLGVRTSMGLVRYALLYMPH